MEETSTGELPTDPELDEALSRAIRQLIAGAIEQRNAESAAAAV